MQKFYSIMMNKPKNAYFRSYINILSINPKLMSLLPSDLLLSELIPFFQQENLFPATKDELLAVAEREGFHPDLIDALKKLPDDNKEYELEQIFNIPENEPEYLQDDEY